MGASLGTAAPEVFIRLTRRYNHIGLALSSLLVSRHRRELSGLGAHGPIWGIAEFLGYPADSSIPTSLRRAAGRRCRERMDQPNV